MRVLFGATLTSVKVLTPSSITQNSLLSAFMVKKKKKKKGSYVFNSALKHLTKPHSDIQGHHIYWVIYCTRSNTSRWVLSTIQCVFRGAEGKKQQPISSRSAHSVIIWRYTENTINGDTLLNGLNDVVNGNHAALQHIVHQWYQLWMMQWANYVNKRWWAMSGH